MPKNDWCREQDLNPHIIHSSERYTMTALPLAHLCMGGLKLTANCTSRNLACLSTLGMRTFAPPPRWCRGQDLNLHDLHIGQMKRHPRLPFPPPLHL